MNAPVCQALVSVLCGSSCADCLRPYLTVFVVFQQGPEDASILVGEHHGSDVLVAPLCNPMDPMACGACRLLIRLVCVVNHRPRVLNPLRAQVGVSATILEVCCIPERGDQHADRDRPDARNLLEPFASRVASMPGKDLLFALLDLRLQRLEVLKQTIHRNSEAAQQFALLASWIKVGIRSVSYRE